VIWATGGRVEPREYDLKEYWTWRPAGKKPWVLRAISKGRVWDDRRGRERDAESVLGGDTESTFQMHATRLGSSASSEEKGVGSVSTPPRVIIRRD